MSGCIITRSTSAAEKIVLGQSAAESRQLDLGRRIVQDVILASHPTEPHTQGHKPRVLRTEAQRLAIGLAVVEQVPLIAFEHGPRDFNRLRDAALFQPVDEELDMTGAAPHRELGVVLHLESLQVFRASVLQAASERGPGLCASLHEPSLAPFLVAVVTMQRGYDGIFFRLFPNSVFWLVFEK